MIRTFIRFLDLISYYVRHELFRYKKDERAKIVKCPVCGHLTLNQSFICNHCHWEYESEYEDKSKYSQPSYSNGNLNIYEYRENAKKQYGIKIRNIK